MKVTEVGSCAAILSAISTKIDGSIKVSFEINPQDQAIIAKLLQAYTVGDKLFNLGILQVKE